MRVDVTQCKFWQVAKCFTAVFSHLTPSQLLSHAALWQKNDPRWNLYLSPRENKSLLMTVTRKKYINTQYLTRPSDTHSRKIPNKLFLTFTKASGWHHVSPSTFSSAILWPRRGAFIQQRPRFIKRKIRGCWACPESHFAKHLWSCDQAPRHPASWASMF